MCETRNLMKRKDKKKERKEKKKKGKKEETMNLDLNILSYGNQMEGESLVNELQVNTQVKEVKRD